MAATNQTNKISNAQRERECDEQQRIDRNDKIRPSKTLNESVNRGLFVKAFVFVMKTNRCSSTEFNKGNKIVGL